MHKKIGQYFTNKNIFNNEIFISWFNSIPIQYRLNILEPFAGKNGLINMLYELNLIQSFSSFDIEPQDLNVTKNDSLKKFPIGYYTCITNPPFLAKNIATRKNILIQIEPYNDLYEKCLNLCLENCDFVAVIVPESFIVSKFFKSRLFCVISLNQKTLFHNTEHPVCLALFNKDKTLDFKVYQNNEYIGFFNKKLLDIQSWLGNFTTNNVLFHDKTGELGLINIDATNIDKKICFTVGNLINSKDVGKQSRLRTRIKIITPENKPLTIKEMNLFIILCNKNLNIYRTLTKDIFLTSFKGLRSDGKYRRRLDYFTAKLIVFKSYKEFFLS